MSSPRLNFSEGEPDFDRYDADEKAWEDSQEDKRLFKRDESLTPEDLLNDGAELIISN